MRKEKNLAEHARDKTGPYDLSGGVSAPPISEALADLVANTARLDRANAELHRRLGEESSPEPRVVELSDEEFYARYQAALAGEQPTGAPKAAAPTGASLSSAEGDDDPGDDGDALLAWYRGVLDGSDARRRGLESTRAARAEYVEYWRREHELGRPVPRDLEDEILRGSR